MENYKNVSGSTPGAPGLPANQTARTLLVYYLLQGVSEFDRRAASPAAAQSSQCSSCQANHASSRSFRGMSIPSKKSSISALSISSGYLFVSRPGIYTFASGSVKTEMQKKFGSFLRFLLRRIPGKCRARPVRGSSCCWDPGQLGLVFLREFGSL